MKILKKIGNVKYVWFFDEIFTLNKKRVIEICNKIIEEKVNIKWFCDSRVDLVDKKLLKLMRKAGCIGISYGVESGSQKILDAMNKGIKIEQAKQWTEKDILNLNVGYVKLDLVPRGIGELLVKAQQLFFSIKPGSSVQVPIELVNDGTRSLNNVEIDVDLPLNWTHSVDPKNIDRLNVSEEKRSIVNIIPSEDVAVGRYEVRVSTTSLSDEQPIAGEDKTITVEIQAETNILGTIIIILLILGLVGGMVIFGIKLSRR